MKTKKREFPLFSFNDTTGMERHLEKMAKKGWMLDEFTNFSWQYVRCEPKKVHFTVTYYPKASAFDPEPSEGQQSFEEFCSHGGWRLAASNAKLMAFVNEEENPVPIHTDPEIELEMAEQSGKQNTILWFVLLAVSVFSVWTNISQFISEPSRSFSSPMQLVNTGMMLLLGVYEALELFTWFSWRKKARTAAAQGDALPKTKGNDWLIKAVLLYMVLGLVYILLAASDTRIQMVLMLNLASIVLLIALVNGVRVSLKKKKVSAAENRTITLLVDVVAAIIVCGINIWVVFQLPSVPQKSSAQGNLTVETLTGQTETGKADLIEHDESFLLSRTQFCDEADVPDENGNTASIEYELLETPFAPIRSICLKELLHQYDDYGDYKENGSGQELFYVYLPADPAPWGAQKAWQQQAYGEMQPNYLVCWDHTILKLETDRMLDAQQMSRAAERLGQDAAEQ